MMLMMVLIIMFTTTFGIWDNIWISGIITTITYISTTPSEMELPEVHMVIWTSATQYFTVIELKHHLLVFHTCVAVSLTRVITDLDNGMSPYRHQDIVQSNDGFSSTTQKEHTSTNLHWQSYTWSYHM